MNWKLLPEVFAIQLPFYDRESLQIKRMLSCEKLLFLLRTRQLCLAVSFTSVLKPPAATKTMRFLSTIQSALICGALIGACAACPAIAADIVQAARADGHFTKLIAANTTAGTASLLEQTGPFTLFAPDDEAFAKVPPGKMNALLAPSMRTMLKVTLANHVVTGLVDMASLRKALGEADAVVVVAANNMPLVFKRDGDQLTVNGAHITKGPMKADNGLVYVVDAVLMPAKPLQAHY